MAPKKKEAEPITDAAPARQRVEDELQQAIETGDSKLSQKLELLKAVPEPCRVVLYMANCKLATQPVLHQVVENLPPTLIELSLIYCQQLTELPISTTLAGILAPTLKCLNLNMCTQLVSLPAALSTLVNLSYLDISWCERLTSEAVPDLTALKELKKLDCAGCRCLQILPGRPKLPPLKDWDPVSRTGLRKPDHPSVKLTPHL